MTAPSKIHPRRSDVVSVLTYSHSVYSADSVADTIYRKQAGHGFDKWNPNRNVLRVREETCAILESLVESGFAERRSNGFMQCLSCARCAYRDGLLCRLDLDVFPEDRCLMVIDPRSSRVMDDERIAWWKKERVRDRTNEMLYRMHGHWPDWARYPVNGFSPEEGSYVIQTREIVRFNRPPISETKMAELRAWRDDLSHSLPSRFSNFSQTGKRKGGLRMDIIDIIGSATRVSVTDYIGEHTGQTKSEILRGNMRAVLTTKFGGGEE